MTVIELKEKLIAKISSTDNEELLEHLSDVIEFEHNNDVYMMSAGEIAAVEEGIAQIEKGEWITNEEANRHADEWLRK